MKSVLSWIFALLLLSSLALAQSGPAANDKSSAAANPPVVTAEQVRALQEAIAAQQKQIDQQQKQIEALRQQLTEQSTPHVADAALHTLPADSPARAMGGDTAPEEQKESPLSFRIGKMDFTPGGYVEFQNVFRTTNTGNVVGTTFGAIPFNNTIQGHLTEDRMSAQSSRLSLKATGTFGANQITGYVEADFNGNDAANVFVTSNSHTNRLRLYWVDVRRGKWEFLGGQSWSWLTPNRNGLSPLPADVFYTQDQDQNFQVGLPWTRAAQFRVAYHPNEHWGIGLSLENPQQFVGVGEVNFPFAFNAALGGQFDPTTNPGTPNLHPDLIPKIAYDTDLNGKHFHVEVVGLLTSVKTTHVPIGGTTFSSRGTTGGGGGFGANLELFKNFRLVANGFWGEGGGRYLGGLGPDVVVTPIATSPTTFTLDTSMVHSGSGVVGFEAQVTKNHMLSAYWGGAYFQRNAFPDVTNPIVLVIPIACTTGGVLQTKPCVGFGGTNSPNSANRAIQEATLDWDYTFWQNRNYGALQLRTQWSYLTRSPWFVAAGAPKNAHLFMGWVAVRYVLP